MDDTTTSTTGSVGTEAAIAAVVKFIAATYPGQENGKRSVAGRPGKFDQRTPAA